MESVTITKVVYESVCVLPEIQKERMLWNIMRYVFGGVEPDGFKYPENALWPLVKESLDAANRRRHGVDVANRVKAAKRGVR